MFRASLFLKNKMRRLHAPDDAVGNLCEKEDSLMEVIERMVDELDDSRVAGLVE